MSVHSHDESDFLQFAGFDRAARPPSGLAESIRFQIGQEAAKTATEPVPLQAVVTHPEQQLRSNRSSRRWMSTLEAAAAILVVLSLVGSLFVLEQGDGLRSYFALQQDTDDMEVNESGNAGATWVLGESQPSIGSPITEPPILTGSQQFLTFAGSPVVIGDDVVYGVVDARNDHSLASYDLDARQRNWIVPLRVNSNLVSDGRLVFVLSQATSPDVDTGSIVALDLDTGEVAWTGLRQHQPQLAPAKLVIVGATLLVANQIGDVLALDVSDGSVRWQTQVGESDPAAFGVPASPQLVTDDTTAFVTGPDLTISALDLSTGNVVATTDLARMTGWSPSFAILQLDGTTLVATSIQPQDDEVRSQEEIPSNPARILFMETSSLEVRHDIQLEDARGNAAVTDGKMYVPARTAADPIARVYSVDLASGQLSEPLPGISAGSGIHLSVSGSVLMAASDLGSVSFFDIDRNGLLATVPVGSLNRDNPFEWPVVMWRAHPIVLTALGEVLVFHDLPVPTGVPVSDDGQNVNPAGDPGGSWMLGEADPEMGEVVEAGSILGDERGFDQNRQRGIIVDDSFIFPTYGVKSWIHRSEISGIATLWSVSIEALSNLVSDGQNVYLQGAAFSDDPSSRFLVAISIETGAIMWQVAGVPTPELWTTSLIISDGVIYVANTAGEVMAVTAADGAVIWHAAIGNGGIATEPMLLRNPAAPFLALGDGGLFVVTNDQAVVRLDALTGKETGRIDTPVVVGSSSITTIPQVRGGTLCLMVLHGDGNLSRDGDTVPVTFMFADAATLVIEHQVEFPEHRGGNMALTNDFAYVPVSSSANAPAHVVRIDLTSGEATEPFGEVTSAGPVFLSISGETLMVAAGDTGSVSFIDRYSGEMLATVQTGYSSETGGSFSHPILIWDGKPIAIDGLGNDHLVVDDPGSIAEAMPVSTPARTAPGG